MTEPSGPPPAAKPKSRLKERIYLYAGLLQGVVYYLACTIENHPLLAAFAATFTAFAGTSLLLTWKPGKGRFTAPPLIALSLVLSFCALWAATQTQTGGGHCTDDFDLYKAFFNNDILRTILIFGGSLSLFLLSAFVQTATDEGRFSFPYPRLFRHVWSNLFILILAFYGVLLFWILIGLWGALFNLVKIDIFSRFFDTNLFFLVATSAVFSLGLALTRKRKEFLETVTFINHEKASFPAHHKWKEFPDRPRSIFSSILEFLVPMFAGVVVLFLAIIPIVGLAPLWSTNRAALILLWAQAVLIFFIFFVVLKDRESPPESTILRLSTEIAALCLPFLAGLSVNALALRVSQYGLTPARVLGIAICALLALLSLGSAAAVIKSRIRGGPWLGLVRPVNKMAALCAIVAVPVLLTPPFSPLGLSARNQFNRLVNGRVDPDEFDFKNMKNNYGPEGRRLFKILKDVKELESRWGLEAQTARAVKLGADRAENACCCGPGFAPEDFEVLGGGSLPEGLFTVLVKNLDEYCIQYKGFKLSLLPLDLTGDGEPEYLTVYNNDWYAEVYSRQKSGEWVELGYFHEEGKKIAQGAAQGRIKLLEPEIKNLEINGRIIQFHPKECYD